MCRCSTIYNTRELIFQYHFCPCGKNLCKIQISSKTGLRKSWSSKLKAFSIPVVTKNPSISNQSPISIISEINLSPINLFLHQQFVVRKLTLTKKLLDKIALDKLFCQHLIMKSVSRFNVSFNTLFLFNDLNSSLPSWNS